MFGWSGNGTKVSVPEAAVHHSSRSRRLPAEARGHEGISPPIPQVTYPGATISLAAPKARWLESLLEPNADSPICLAESVAEEVFLHLAMNLDPQCAPDMPQILILTGSFGIGKTVSLEETLTRVGCKLVRLQAAEMESPHAGVPVQRILEAYAKASHGQGETNQPHALVMEDIHLAFGVDTNTTKTIHTQLTVAALMGICDDCANVAGRKTERIAIFATANDLSNVYGGLLRPGRTRVYAVQLSPADRQRIVTHMFQGLLTPGQAGSLCEARPDWSMAAFRQLKSYLARRSFQQRHAGLTANELLRSLLMRAKETATPSGAAAPVAERDLDDAVQVVDAEADAKRDFTAEPAKPEPVC